MARTRIPKGPWDNGVHEDGEHDAIIHGIERGAYGRDDGFYFKIVLWLVDQRLFLVTNIYVREDTDRTASQRIWHLCQACEDSGEGFHQRLGEFRGKHLRVRMVTVPPSQSGASERYSDVDRFLRPTAPLKPPSWTSYQEATTQKPASPRAEKKLKARKRVRDMFAV